MPEARQDPGSGCGAGKGFLRHLGTLSGLASWPSQSVLCDAIQIYQPGSGLAYRLKDGHPRGKREEVPLLPTTFGALAV